VGFVFREAMKVEAHRPILFPPINRHGVIGDRRTGALVAADGTLDWFCAPDFDGTPIFGALLDPEKGGHCRLGPIEARLGEQHYLPNTVAVVTTWSDATSRQSLELTDLMAWPAKERDFANRSSRVIIRRLRLIGVDKVYFDICPRFGFLNKPQAIVATRAGVTFRFDQDQLATWTSFPLRIEGSTARSVILSDNQELWVAIAWNLQLEDWSLQQVTDLFQESLSYWQQWSDGLNIDSEDFVGPRLRRSAMIVHLLTHADYECSVAALTTSLPERRGGDRNYDYRYAWVRDDSLSLALLAGLGKTEEVEHYLDRLSGLESCTNSPLQVCYRLDGRTDLPEIELSALRGYADSRPVRYGNRAARQNQLGSLAFFADCARIYVEHGGRWRPEYWRLLRRVANYACESWHLPENGIWELALEAHFVASKVLSWVILERAVRIADLTGHDPDSEVVLWSKVAEAIHSEVMTRGWSQKQNSFVQRYDSEGLDAALLLIPLMDFLPPEHPRVLATLTAIERKLVVDGLVHRFDPTETLGCDQLPIGSYEGAFFPATFWFAHALAKSGQVNEADAIVKRCETIAGELGLFAEEADAREGIFLGNTPLLFAQVEYARAIRAIAEAKRA
jgi:alpha,alpha-trehalase